MLLKDKDDKATCDIAALRAISNTFKLYTATSVSEKSEHYLARISTDNAYDGSIIQEKQRLESIWNALESARQVAGEESYRSAGYYLLFPKLASSFVSEKSQGDRQVNLLSAIEADIWNFFPIAKLSADYCIDAKTAAWIFGRFLKIMACFYMMDMPYAFDVDQILIEPKNHRILDPCWLSDQTIDGMSAKDNISAAASFIKTWTMPHGIVHEEDFMELMDFYTRSVSLDDPNEMHVSYYNTINTWWKRGYYPFTYYDKSSNIWKTEPNK